jgi:hypothetical protein
VDPGCETAGAASQGVPPSVSMSAPIAVSTLVGGRFYFHNININSFVGCGACGYVGEGEHFSAPGASLGSGAGWQSRSFTYLQAFLVNLPRRAIAEALMLALLVVQHHLRTPTDDIP